jgi:hypothetical protein
LFGGQAATSSSSFSWGPGEVKRISVLITLRERESITRSVMSTLEAVFPCSYPLDTLFGYRFAAIAKKSGKTGNA